MSVFGSIQVRLVFFYSASVFSCLRVRYTVYFVKNWKYYNKIIFKYMNSIVKLIFKENFGEKRDLWDPWTVHETHWIV